MPTVALTFGTGINGVGWSQLSLQTTFNFGQNTGEVMSYVLTNQNSPCTPQQFPLNSGNTTINATVCPALPEAGGVWIIPGPTNGSALTLKGATGDTGIALNLTAPTFIPFAVSPPTSFVINAAATCSTMVLLWV